MFGQQGYITGRDVHGSTMHAYRCVYLYIDGIHTLVVVYIHTYTYVYI